jgi:glucosamine--fructose-6-phosphate aminotransferase (isomerizing)
MSFTVLWYISFQVEIYITSGGEMPQFDPFLAMNPPASPISLLERELSEQGSVLARRAAIMSSAEDAAHLLSGSDVNYLLIAARGSSDNAARFGQYALGLETHLNVALAAPSLFKTVPESPDLRGAAVLGISQSGQSPDIVGVLAAARDQGRPTIAITNDDASPLAAVADVVVPLATGPERSVAATKTYLASLHALMQIVEALRPDPERRAWLERLPAEVDATVADYLERRDQFDRLDDAAVLTMVGRGLDFSTAHETGLKIRELSAMVTEAFSPADLLHGPVAALGRPGGLWIVDTAPRLGADTHTVLAKAHERGMQTVIVSQEAPSLGRHDRHIEISPAAPHWVGAILAVLPGQIAALHIAALRGVDLDHPHGLSKVTLTH